MERNTLSPAQLPCATLESKLSDRTTPAFALATPRTPASSAPAAAVDRKGFMGSRLRTLVKTWNVQSKSRARRRLVARKPWVSVLTQLPYRFLLLRVRNFYCGAASEARNPSLGAAHGSANVPYWRPHRGRISGGARREDLDLGF